MFKFLIPVSFILILISCKETVKDSSTLPQENSSKTESAAEQEKSCCDTVILEKDTTAVDVKESEVAPEILETAKPVYSMEMIENKVEGTVKLKLLVGTDGLIKEYIILNDLGHGTHKAIYTALIKMKFSAARKNKKRVSVWIETTLYFRLPNIEY